jgi:hypothetical protein
VDWREWRNEELHDLYSFLTIGIFKLVGLMKTLSKGFRFVIAAVAIRAM